MKKILFIIILIISNTLCYGNIPSAKVGTASHFGIKEECRHDKHHKIFINSLGDVVELSSEEKKCIQTINRIHREKIEKIIAEIIIYLLILTLIIYLIYLGKRFFPKFKLHIEKSRDAIREHNIRKIILDETIRSNIKKNINKTDEQDLEKLQDLINQAIEKGDSEMAQTLLKILNKSKNK